MAITYSDGHSIETRLWEIVRGSVDRRSYVALGQEHFGSWPVQYHLSPERSNLLRPFHWEGLSVLELGAGMGAVSRLLAERAQSLYVIEGTESRYRVLKERLRGLDNWDGEVANFQQAQCTQKFDVVCAVGVLEYSELYLEGKSPAETFFGLAQRFLKPDGVLVLAIENKLGMKYWSGSAEDHTGRLFDGICGYPETPTPRTFSRKELAELFQNAGFSELKQFFPFPDYKLAVSLMGEELIDLAPELAKELATQQAFVNGGLPQTQFFPNLLALETLTKAGLLKDFSNSFLFVGSRQKDSAVLHRLLPRELAWHYSLRRKIPIQTVFEKTDSPSLMARKRPLAAVSQKDEVLLGDYRWSSLGNQPVVEGASLRSQLLRHAYYGQWDRFTGRLLEFLRWGKQHYSDGEGLKSEAVDLVFSNVLVVETGFQAFDLEWSSTNRIPMSWWISRNVFQLGREKLALGGCGFTTLSDLYSHLCTELGVRPDLESDLQREADFQATVSDQPNPARFLPVLKTLFAAPLGEDTYARLPQKEAALRGQWCAEPRPSFFRRGLRRFKRLLQPARKSAGEWGAATEGLAVWKAWGKIPESAHLEIVFKGQSHSKNRLDFKRRGWRNAYVLTRDLGPIQSATLIGATGEVTVAPLSRVGVAWEFVRLFFTRPWRGGAAPLFPLLLQRLGQPGVFQLRPWRHFLKTVFHGRLVSKIDRYSAWIDLYEVPAAGDSEKALARVQSQGVQPLVSVILPTYESPENWLRAALDSVLAQWYPHWELCIADDASAQPHVRKVLEEYRLKDRRIKVVYREKNGHISEASNSALQLATGDYVALLDHDDMLAPDALIAVVDALHHFPQARLIYSDEDKIDGEGRRFSPHFKPDWNPDLFYNINLITHLAVFEKRLIDEVGGFRQGYEGSQDYDLMLRVVEKLQPSEIHHIPHILYHWRAIPGSVALAPEEKHYAHDRARLAIASHLERKGVKAKVTPGSYSFFHRVVYDLPEKCPLVSVVICTRDKKKLLETAVRGVLEETAYPHLELLLVDNGSVERETLAYLEAISRDPRVRVISYDAVFNFAQMNNLAAQQARGEFLLFLNNDIEVTSPDWLEELVGQALQDGVGAVGAKLLYPDGSVQHAGVLLGLGGVADHPHRGAARSAPGYFGRALCSHSVGAVTGACLLVRKSLFEKVGAFDAALLPVAYNDIDLCLKLREAGYRIIWTPFAELTHHESASRGADDTPERRKRLEAEMRVMQTRWKTALEKDPAYNPNLDLEDAFSLSFPPRAAKPWLPV